MGTGKKGTSKDAFFLLPSFPGTTFHAAGWLVEQHARWHSGEPRRGEPPLQPAGEPTTFSRPQHSEAVDQVFLDRARRLAEDLCSPPGYPKHRASAIERISGSNNEPLHDQLRYDLRYRAVRGHRDGSEILDRLVGGPLELAQNEELGCADFQVTLDSLSGRSESAHQPPHRVERAGNIGLIVRLPGHARICFVPGRFVKNQLQ